MALIYQYITGRGEMEVLVDLKEVRINNETKDSSVVLHLDSIKLKA